MSNDLERSILHQEVISNFYEDGTEHVREYLDAVGDPNLIEPRLKMSLLTMCVTQGAEELVERLLHLGADPNLTDTFCESALHAAIRHEWRRLADGGPRHVLIETPPWKPMYKKLIAAGADVNFICRGQTPLHLAARRGLTHVAKFLVESGADLYAMDDEDKTPYGAASDVREYLQDAMRRQPGAPNLSWFDIDKVFDSVRGYINDLTCDVMTSHPQQGLIASLVCLRLIGAQFPKNLSANFCKQNLARVKGLFYDCYSLVEGDLPPNHRDTTLANAEREFALFEERIRRVPDNG